MQTYLPGGRHLGRVREGVFHSGWRTWSNELPSCDHTSVNVASSQDQGTIHKMQNAEIFEAMGGKQC